MQRSVPIVTTEAKLGICLASAMQQAKPVYFASFYSIMVNASKDNINQASECNQLTN
jgi:hypothetical protein